MDKVIKQDFINDFVTNFKTPYTSSIYEWAKDNLDLPPAYAIQGSFDVSISPYLIKPFEDLKNKNVQQVNLIAATQTFKTGVEEVFINYTIINDPGPTLKLHQSDEMSNLFMETRLIPLLENCGPIRKLLDHDRFSATKKGINLPHMFIKAAGAKENVLHGQGIRYLLLDEVWLYDPDTVQKAKSRTTAFGNNKKILLTSQPGIEGDQLDEEKNKGFIYEWGWKCKECNILQPWYWSKGLTSGSLGGKNGYAGIIWEKKFKENTQEYDYEATANTAKLYCEHCTASYNDTLTNRQYLNNTGEYITIKDNGNSAIHTYSWCAFVNNKISFKEKVIEYLQATVNHKRYGNTDGLRIFRQQVMGQCWRRSQPIDPAKVLTAIFKPEETWKDEIFRTMTVDYQRKNETKFYTVVAFSNKEIRVLEHSFVAKWEQITEVARKYNIKAPAIMIDSGYNSAEVYEQSVAHCEPIVVGKKIVMWGWACGKGDGGHDEGYSHKHPITGQTLKKYYAPELKVALNNHQFARLYLWANLPIKTMFAHIRDGKSDIKLVLPSTDPDWEEQINAESLEWIQDAKTGLKIQRWIAKHDRNHYFDCMCMALIMSHIRGVFSVDVIDSKAVSK